MGLGESAASVLGSFLRFAGEMKDRKFREVRLAFRGQTRFILNGDEFAEIGQEFGWQNPVYTLRTFPEKLQRPDGRPAFSRWSGGLLGVTGAQMKDLNGLADQWYRSDLRRRYSSRR